MKYSFHSLPLSPLFSVILKLNSYIPRERAIRATDFTRTQIAPDVKSKYDPPTSSLLSSPPSLRSGFHPRHQGRFASAERATRTFSFNSRGIIRRIPRLVASLDEEENKLYDHDIPQSSVGNREARGNRCHIPKGFGPPPHIKLVPR